MIQQYIFLLLSLVLLPRSTISDAEVPLAPTSVDLIPLTPESIRVDFTPPSSDRGSEITSYLVEWDTNPGVREVQEVRTRSYTGANEVQEISVSIASVPEVQTISTSASFLPTIQSVKTSANPGSVLNSEFSLELDLTSMGGASELSGTIQHDADEATMKAVLESMQNIQAPVDVNRSGPDAQGGYTWLVTFTGGMYLSLSLSLFFLFHFSLSIFFNSNSLFTTAQVSLWINLRISPLS